MNVALRGPALASRRDRVLSVVVTFCSLLSVLAFLWIVADLFRFGLSELSFSYFLENPRSAGREGGIFSVVVSTLAIVSIAMVTALPLGLFAAMWLSESRHDPGQSRYHQIKKRGVSCVRFSIDALAGVPSVVFGLFGNAFFCVTLDMGFSILSGGLTLACMVLPIFIRQSEEALSAVSYEHRRAALALGISRGGTLFRVILPTALPALSVGFALGLGRALAETAALIFTSGYVDRTPESLFDSGRSLSIHIYDLAMNVPGGNARAYSAALVLVLLLLLINGAAALFTWRFTPRSTQ